MQRSSIHPWLLAAALVACGGCSREKERPVRTEPWPAPAAASSGPRDGAPERARYRLETSDIRFELPAKRATPRGRLPNASGHFEVDLAEPARTRGSLRFDLTELELEPDEAEPDATRRALEWLGLGAEVPRAERERHRFATFVVSALESRTSTRLSANPGKKLDFVARGELALHGVRAPESVPVVVETRDATADGAAPERIVIRSARPLVVSLSIHDIRPRNARGVLVARDLELLGDKVGREARVSFELVLRLER